MPPKSPDSSEVKVVDLLSTPDQIGGKRTLFRTKNALNHAKFGRPRTKLVDPDQIGPNSVEIAKVGRSQPQNGRDQAVWPNRMNLVEIGPNSAEADRVQDGFAQERWPLHLHLSQMSMQVGTGPSGMGRGCGGDSGSVRGFHLRSIRDRRAIGSKSAWRRSKVEPGPSRCWRRSGSIRGPFGAELGPIRGRFGDDQRSIRGGSEADSVSSRG